MFTSVYVKLTLCFKNYDLAMIRDVTQLAYMFGLELPCVIGQIHTNKNLLRSKIPAQVAVGGVPYTHV